MRLQLLWVQQVVGVKKLDVLATGFNEAEIARNGGTGVLLVEVTKSKSIVPVVLTSPFLHDLPRVVGGSIVNNDQFNRPIVLLKDGVHGFNQKTRAVERWNNHGRQTRFELITHPPPLQRFWP
jgi:hypothetical protein